MLSKLDNHLLEKVIRQLNATGIARMAASSKSVAKLVNYLNKRPVQNTNWNDKKKERERQRQRYTARELLKVAISEQNLTPNHRNIIMQRTMALPHNHLPLIIRNARAHIRPYVAARKHMTNAMNEGNLTPNQRNVLMQRTMGLPYHALPESLANARRAMRQMLHILSVRRRWRLERGELVNF
jgi:hypothetical protein